MGRTPDPRFHPKVVKLAPVTVALVVALVEAIVKNPISGY